MASDATKALDKAQATFDAATAELVAGIGGPDVGKLAAQVGKAESARNKAAQGVHAENVAEFMEKAADSRKVVVEALNNGKTGDAMHTLYNAGIRSLSISFLDDGSFTMDEKRAKGMREGGTRNVDKYAVNGATPLTAARLIETFGPSRADFAERSEAISDGTLKRKAYAEEITEDMGGEVVS